MKKLIQRLKPFASNGNCLNVIVETPKGSRVKYAYDPETGFLILSKVLPDGMIFPFNFGFIPKTVADDGDPLDVLVLNEEPLIAGCLLQVKPIGIIKASQAEKGKTIRNDRIIGQAIGKESPAELKSMTLEKETVSHIEFFFTAYNKLYGKKFEILGTGGPAKAKEIIRRAMRLFKREKD